MQLLKIGAAIVALSFSALVHAQAHFVCGDAQCPSTVYVYDGPSTPYVYGDPTGIDDLNVRGDLFDVTFTTTAPASSPFMLSNAAAAPGQPLTGIDAGNAISAFYAALLPPYTTGYYIQGDPGPAFVTALAPAGDLSANYNGATELWDVSETLVGGGLAPPTYIFGSNDYRSSNPTDFYTTDNIRATQLYYTEWTPIAAPEIDPNFMGSGLVLLFGGIAVLRGRKMRIAP